MKKMKISIWLLVLMIAVSLPIFVSAEQPLPGVKVFKGSIVSETKTISWTYEFSKLAEWEQGTLVLTGDDALEKITDLYQFLQIGPKANVDKMVHTLRLHGYDPLDRLDIRYQDGKGDLYTWVWHK